MIREAVQAYEECSDDDTRIGPHYTMEQIGELEQEVRTTRRKLGAAYKQIEKQKRLISAHDSRLDVVFNRLKQHSQLLKQLTKKQKIFNL